MQKMMENTKTNNVEQVGGTHYNNPIQPWDIIAKYNLNWFQGEILKYVTRFRFKGQKQDLMKAISIAEKANLSGIHGIKKPDFKDIPFLLQYVQMYTIYEPGDKLLYLYNIIVFTLSGEWTRVVEQINLLISELWVEN